VEGSSRLSLYTNLLLVSSRPSLAAQHQGSDTNHPWAAMYPVWYCVLALKQHHQLLAPASACGGGTVAWLAHALLMTNWLQLARQCAAVAAPFAMGCRTLPAAPAGFETGRVEQHNGRIQLRASRRQHTCNLDGTSIRKRCGQCINQLVVIASGASVVLNCS
jgi:hypothetical protein